MCCADTTNKRKTNNMTTLKIGERVNIFTNDIVLVSHMCLVRPVWSKHASQKKHTLSGRFISVSSPESEVI